MTNLEVDTVTETTASEKKFCEKGKTFQMPFFYNCKISY